jgi:TonB family protein
MRILTALLGLILSTQIISALSNSDVITLHTAGIGADTIVLAINNAETKDFDVSAEALVKLKEADVDEAVIQAILMTAGNPPIQSAVEQKEITPAPVEFVNATEEPVVESPPPMEVKVEPPVSSVVATAPVLEPEPAAEPVVQVRARKKTPPQPLYRPAPTYPTSLKQQGISGSVMIKFVVNKEGGVQDIEIVNSDHDLFSAAASEALSSWKFRPGTLDGEPFDSDVKLEIPFNINEQLSPLNRAPKAMYKPKPNFPKSLRDKGVTGYVKVQFVVTDAGEVQNIAVVASDHELFTEEAIKVLKQWKFAPALKDGQPISSRVQFSIPFKITE